MTYPRHDLTRHVLAGTVDGITDGCAACDQRSVLFERLLKAVAKATADGVNVTATRLYLNPETWKTILVSVHGVTINEKTRDQALYGIPVSLDGALAVGDIELRWSAKA